jgi:hypothetical protein
MTDPESQTATVPLLLPQHPSRILPARKLALALAMACIIPASRPITPSPVLSVPLLNLTHL